MSFTRRGGQAPFGPIAEDRNPRVCSWGVQCPAVKAGESQRRPGRRSRKSRPRVLSEPRSGLSQLLLFRRFEHSGLTPSLPRCYVRVLHAVSPSATGQTG
jgi:hypothetical protein